MKTKNLEETRKNLVSLYDKVRHGYNFESRNYVCHITFDEAEALKTALKVMDRVRKQKEVKNEKS